MAISDTTTRNTQCSSYAAQCTHVAGHTAYPATSANELTGTGAARGLITWSTPASGSMTGTATIVSPTAGGTWESLGLWSALTSGTRHRSDHRDAAVPVANRDAGFALAN
jgi:hypothetical protein